MRISDWSSDVCSSDLERAVRRGATAHDIGLDRIRLGAAGECTEQAHAALGVGRAAMGVERAAQIIFGDLARGRLIEGGARIFQLLGLDRKSTRLNSSH